MAHDVQGAEPQPGAAGVDLGLCCTTPAGSPWGAVQMGAQAWDRQALATTPY